MKTLALASALLAIIWIHHRRRYHRLATAVGAHYAEAIRA